MSDLSHLEGLTDARALVANTFRRSFQPPPNETMWEWADNHRKLSSKSSAEEGQYRSDRFMFAREIMNAIAPSSPVDTVVVVKSAQMGITEAAALNVIAYYAVRAPCAIAFVMPTEEMAKDTKRTRIDPMVDLCDELRAIVRDPRKSRDAGNTIALMEFPGGNLRLRGANSAAGLRGWTAKVVIGDDIDVFPASAGEEGDPLMLVERATLTYQGRRKLVWISTPTIEGQSRICGEWSETDQSFYHVPCPHCGELSPMAWSSATRFVIGARKFVFFNGDAKRDDELDAHIKCESCQGRIEDHEREWMNANGVWVPTFPERSARARGFHISRLYSPAGMGTLTDLVRNFRKARKGGEVTLRVFFNRDLGEPWYEKGERPEWKRLYDLRESYKIGTVPRGGLVLLASADVQADRIEVAIDAYGEDMEYWSVDYRILLGSPSEPQVWLELERVMQTTYRHEDGAHLSIRALGIDSGFATQEVYGWCRRQPKNRVFALKGDPDGTSAIVATPRKVEVRASGKRFKRGLMLWHVGGAVAKAEIYGKLRLERPLDGQPFAPGYRHYPQWSDEHFRQLTAEEIKPVLVRGFRRYVWQKVHERNEVLDCAVYSRAVASILGIDRWQHDHWTQIADAIGSTPKAEPQTRAPATRQLRPPTVEQRPSTAPRGWSSTRGSGWGTRRNN